MWRDRPEAIGPRRRRRLVAPASRRRTPLWRGPSSFSGEVLSRCAPSVAATDAGSISPIVDRWCTEPSSYPDQEERRASSEGKKRSPRPYDRWALRDSNPRPSPCKGDRNMQVKSLTSAKVDTSCTWDYLGVPVSRDARAVQRCHQSDRGSTQAARNRRATRNRPPPCQGTPAQPSDQHFPSSGHLQGVT
jgi:hypothetical protein